MLIPSWKVGRFCRLWIESRSPDDKGEHTYLLCHSRTCFSVALSACDSRCVRTWVCAALGLQLQRRESASGVGPAPCSCDSIAGLAWLPADFAGTSSARSSCEICSGLGWRPASSSYKVHTVKRNKQELKHLNVAILCHTTPFLRSHVCPMKGHITFKAIHVSLWRKEEGDVGIPNMILLLTRVKRCTGQRLLGCELTCLYFL